MIDITPIENYIHDGIDVVIKSCKDPCLQLTIDSLFETCDYPKKLNVIVIAQCQDIKDDRCNITILEENKGLSYCDKIAYKKLKGDYIFRLPPHSILTKGWDTYIRSKKLDRKDILVCPFMKYNKTKDEYDKNALFIQPQKENTHLMYGVHWKPEFEGKKTAALVGVVIAKYHWTLDVRLEDNIFVAGDEIDLSVKSYEKGYTAKIGKPILYHIEHTTRPKWDYKDHIRTLIQPVWKDFEGFKKYVEEVRI